MTRKNAIRLLLSACAGFFVEVVKSQDMQYIVQGDALITFHPGDVVPEDTKKKEKGRSDYRRCMEEQSASSSIGTSCEDPDHPTTLSFAPSKYVPGTASMTLKLDGWKGFEVEMNGKTVKISRQELWDALQ